MIQIDVNTDGLVDFTEFVAATLHVHQLEEHDSVKWQQRSQAAFEKFDIDKDGFITPEELRMVCSNFSLAFFWLDTHSTLNFPFLSYWFKINSIGKVTEAFKQFTDCPLTLFSSVCPLMDRVLSI